MRDDPCTFEEALLSLTANEWKIVFANASRNITRVLQRFLRGGTEINSGILEGLSHWTPVSVTPGSGQDKVQDAIKWLVEHPKEPQVWNETEDLVRLICWKARLLILDARKSAIRLENKKLRELERARAESLLIRSNKKLVSLRRILEPDATAGFRAYLLSTGNKGDHDSLVFFDYCRSHIAAFRLTDKRVVTYNIKNIAAALTTQTGTYWPPEPRTQNARRNFAKRLQEFETKKDI